VKPHAIVLRMVPLDANETPIEKPFKIQGTTLDNIIFIRPTREQETTWKLTGQMQEVVQTLADAAVQTQKTFVILPAGIELLKVSEKWEPMAQGVIINERTEGN